MTETETMARAEEPSLLLQRIKTFIVTYIPALVVFFLFLGLWEFLVYLLQIPFYLLPPPTEIVKTFVERWEQLMSYGWFTFKEALGGYALGCGSGILTALAASRWPWVANALLPYAVASNSVPIIALAPLAIVWFGVDAGSKIAIVTLMCFFPTMISTYRGLVSVDVQSLELMHSYAATPRDFFIKLRIPTALPLTFNALRLSTTLSMIGAVVSEFFGGPVTALGVYIKTEANILHMQNAWAAIIVACFYGIIFYLAIILLERVIMPWHVSFRQKG